MSILLISPYKYNRRIYLYLLKFVVVQPESHFAELKVKVGYRVNFIFGLVILLVILGPVVWVDIFGNSEAIFPYKYPALFSMIVTFVGIWFFSNTDKSKNSIAEKKLFESQYFRSQTGVGIDKPNAH